MAFAAWTGGRLRIGHALAGLAAIGGAAAVTVAAVTAAAGPADAQQQVSVQMTDTCAFASGARPTAVRVAASFPSSAAVGQPIQPAGVQVTVTLPAAAVAALAAQHITAVSGVASLAVTATARQQTANATWAGLTVPPVTLPPTGSVTLTAAGTVAPVQAVQTPSEAFTAGNLTLALTSATPATTHSTAPASPAATTPGSAAGGTGIGGTGPGGTSPGGTSAINVSCTASGDGTALATVPVTNASPKPTTSATASTKKHPAYCPPPKDLPKPVATGGYGCTWVKGYSDVRKLKGAALIGPGLMNLSVGTHIKRRNGIETIDSRGLLLYKGKHELPPARATFLAFGFMPTSATMQLTEVSIVKLVNYLDFNNFAKSFSTAFTSFALRIYNVRVDGAPLPVGPHCRTVRPIRILLRANANYSIDAGGVLAGFAYIPKFTGCGTTENLDPLFTGTISGPHNYIKMTQGNLCTPKPSAFGCPAHKPKPQH